MIGTHSESTFSVPSKVAVKVMAYRDDLLDDLNHNSWVVVDIQWVSHYRQAVMLLVGMLCHIQDNLSLVRYHMEQVWATYR